MASIITVSYSELDTFRQCPLKHQLAYKERWTKPPQPGGALDKGSQWHAVLEQHYLELKACQDREGALTVSADEFAARAMGRIRPLLYHDDGSGGFRSETAELIAWMYSGYLQRWGIDPYWKILSVEHNAVVPLYTPMNRETGEAGRKTRFRLKVKIDLIVRDLDLGHIWVVDHKSCKDLPAQKALELDDQFGLYTLGMRRLDKVVFGQVYNAARTQRNKTGVQTLESRMERYRMYRDDPELLAIEEDAWKTCVDAYGPVPAALRGRDPRSAPNTDTCRWRCDFSEAHLAARKAAGDQQAALRDRVRDFGFVQNFERH